MDRQDESASGPGMGRLDGVHIAIIEDDHGVLEALRMVMTQAGCHVICFTSGNEFLGTFREGLHLDCVLLDPHLPDVNGAQVAHELHKQLSSLPIIGITAQPASPLAHATSRAGARIMLTKPVSARKLVRTVGELTGNPLEPQRPKREK